MIEAAEEKDLYLSTFAQRETELERTAPSWLRSLRRTAIDCFAARGFPTTRQEEWRFTSVAPLTKIPFKLAEPVELDATVLTNVQQHLTFGRWGCCQLVFVNGHFSAALSSVDSPPPGVMLQGLAMALHHDPQRVEPYLARYARFEEQAFVALNTAFLEDGAFVYIPKGLVIEEPIHLLFISTTNGPPAVAHPRNLIIAETNSQARIVESYVGHDGDVYFTNAVTEIVVGENATIDHYKLQRESVQAFHIATLQAYQSRHANLSTYSISLGGALVRHDVNVVMDGEGSECTLNGFYMVKGHQHVDNHTTIEHARPHGTSRELYKGILDDHARGVFNGRIIVRPGAQKTDAKQTNKNLILSEDALVNTNPQLEIYADDVKCTHGATIGQLDAEALFYLRSRGLDLETARHLLTYAFASDITSRIKIATLRTGLECTLFTKLPHGSKVMEGL